MEKELAKGAVGNEGKYRVEFKDGKLTAEFIYGHSLFDAGLVFSIDSDMVIEALKKAIPGKIDDSILDIAKSLLKGSSDVAQKPAQ